MKRSLSLFLAFFLLLTNFVAVSATDFVADALRELRNSPVYVYPGTKGTDVNTATELSKSLRPNDSIVLVMFPAEAGQTDGELYQMVLALSEGLDDQKIIGLAVGRKLIGYSPILPDGMAADKMIRADSVSNDSVTALITFAQNIHSWQSTHPMPTPTPTPAPTPKPFKMPEAKDVPIPVWMVIIVITLPILVLVVGGLKRWISSYKRRRDLAPAMQQLERIEEKIPNIGDRNVRENLKRAVLIAFELLRTFTSEKKPQGKAEYTLLQLISNMEIQIAALIKDDYGTHPLSAEMRASLKKILLKYDDMFIQLQSDGDLSLMTSMIDSSNTMISELGHLEDLN